MWKLAEHLLSSHNELITWVVVGVLVTGVLFKYLPRGLLELVVIMSKDDGRRRAALEAIRLRRPDAATLAPYIEVKSPAESVEKPPELPPAKQRRRLWPRPSRG
jgi:hypothetical protein